MPFYTKLWFWILVIGILLIFIGFIFYVVTKTIGWTIFFVILGILFMIIGIIVGALSGVAGFAERQAERTTEFLASPAGQELVKTAAPLLLAAR